MKTLRLLLSIVVVALAGGPLRASPPPAGQPDLDARVAHAQAFTSMKLDAKALNTMLTFHWIGAGKRFWFRKALDAGSNAYIVVDARTGRQGPLFDRAKMAAALGAAGTGAAPVIRDAAVADDGRTITVNIPKPNAVCRWPQLYDACEMPVDQFRCDLPVTACTALPAPLAADRRASPDGRSVVHVVGHNLWLTDVATGRERQLTTAGIDGFAYGTVHDQLETFAASRRRIGASDPLSGVLWSPDGRYIVALRHDVRALSHRLVLTEYVPPEGGLPVIHTKKTASAATSSYPEATLEVISVSDGAIRRVDIDPHAFEDMGLLYFLAGRVWWDMPRDQLWLIAGRRAGLVFGLVRIDLRSGAGRPVIDETGDKPLVLNMNSIGGVPNVAVLPGRRQAIWFSERDGWGHLYLYDTETGRPIRQLTKGPWLVADLLRVDEAKRTLYFTAMGKESGANPYYGASTRSTSTVASRAC